MILAQLVSDLDVLNKSLDNKSTLSRSVRKLPDRSEKGQLDSILYRGILCTVVIRGL